jgi:hypothetical protein
MAGAAEGFAAPLPAIRSSIGLSLRKYIQRSSAISRLYRGWAAVRISASARVSKSNARNRSSRE